MTVLFLDAIYILTFQFFLLIFLLMHKYTHKTTDNKNKYT